MAEFTSLTKRDIPEPIHWSKAIGVGIVVMGLAMGTGELILWPHLVVKHGLGILWLALVGIACQFFINREVARHSIATGESFFTSCARVIFWSPLFWFASAIMLYIWPGWASAVGTILKELLGFGSYLAWSWATLGLILVLTFSGRVAYRTLERSLKITVPAFFLILVAISFFNLDWEIIKAAFLGVVNFGYIPKDVDINVLLGAVVFAGAGGMLNLAISLWYRDKQIGMGQYAERIINPITGKTQAAPAVGYIFDSTRENLKRWQGWMKYILVDQGIIFFLLGFITLMLLSVNAYAVLAPRGIIPQGLDVAVVQANILGDQWGIVGYKLFLAMAFLMLFSVAWTVIDALTRMLSDIIYTNSRTGKLQSMFRLFQNVSLSHLYYSIIAIVVVIGAVLIPLRQPLTLLVISGVLGGVSMAIYTPVLIYLNNFKLPKQIRPGILTNVVLILISLFFLYFSYRVVVG